MESINGFGIQNSAEICTESNGMALVGTGPTASAMVVLASVLIKEGAREVACVTRSIFPLIPSRSLVLSCGLNGRNPGHIEDARSDEGWTGSTLHTLVTFAKTVSPRRGVTTVCKAWRGTTPPITLDSA